MSIYCKNKGRNQKGNIVQKTFHLILTIIRTETFSYLSLLSTLWLYLSMVDTEGLQPATSIHSLTYDGANSCILHSVLLTALYIGGGSIIQEYIIIRKFYIEYAKVVSFMNSTCVAIFSVKFSFLRNVFWWVYIVITQSVG